MKTIIKTIVAIIRNFVLTTLKTSRACEEIKAALPQNSSEYTVEVASKRRLRGFKRAAFMQNPSYIAGRLNLPDYSTMSPFDLINSAPAIIVKRRDVRSFLEAAFQQGYEYGSLLKSKAWNELTPYTKEAILSGNNTLFTVDPSTKTVESYDAPDVWPVPVSDPSWGRTWIFSKYEAPIWNSGFGLRRVLTFEDVFEAR